MFFHYSLGPVTSGYHQHTLAFVSDLLSGPPLFRCCLLQAALPDCHSLPSHMACHVCLPPQGQDSPPAVRSAAAPGPGLPVVAGTAALAAAGSVAERRAAAAGHGAGGCGPEGTGLARGEGQLLVPLAQLWRQTINRGAALMAPAPVWTLTSCPEGDAKGQCRQPGNTRAEAPAGSLCLEHHPHVYAHIAATPPRRMSSVGA